MVDYDYAPKVAFAQRMIARYGRDITLVKKNADTNDPANPLASTVLPPTEVPAIRAAFVGLVGDSNLGGIVNNVALFKSCAETCLVAADGINDFSEFDFIIDSDATEWKITVAQKFAPGGTAILYFIGVNRP